MFKKLRQENGDTIVEVLIAVMVVGMAITISYAVANRSLRISRQSQERSEAAKIASGQVEYLKALAKETGSNNVFSKGTVFCVKSDGTPTVNGAFAAYGSAIKESDNSLSGYPEACVSGEYHTAIQETSPNQFDVVTRWLGYGSGTMQEVNIKYRLYP